jgi:hypothetical protein
MMEKFWTIYHYYRVYILHLYYITIICDIYGNIWNPQIRNMMDSLYFLYPNTHV